MSISKIWCLATKSFSSMRLTAKDPSPGNAKRRKKIPRPIKKLRKITII